MFEPCLATLDAVSEVPYQNILKACRKCGGYKPKTILFCPRCIVSGKEVGLITFINPQPQSNEIYCHVCHFLCWEDSYPDYRKIVQRNLCSVAHIEIMNN